MESETGTWICAASAVMQELYRSVGVTKALSRMAKLSFRWPIYVPPLTHGGEL